jgi:hypothetical protein
VGNYVNFRLGNNGNVHKWHEMARPCGVRDAETLRCCVPGLEVRRERATRIEPAFSAWEKKALQRNFYVPAQVGVFPGGGANLAGIDSAPVRLNSASFLMACCTKGSRLACCTLVARGPRHRNGSEASRRVPGEGNAQAGTTGNGHRGVERGVEDQAGSSSAGGAGTAALGTGDKDRGNVRPSMVRGSGSITKSADQ